MKTLRDAAVIAATSLGLSLIAYGVWSLFSPGWAALISGVVVLVLVSDWSNKP